MKPAVIALALLLSSAVQATEVQLNCVRSNPRERMAVTVSDSWIGIERMNFVTGVKTEIQGYRTEMTDQRWVYQLNESLQTVTIPTYVLLGSSGKGFIAVDSDRFHCLIHRL